MCVGGGSSTPGILGAEISPPVLRTANESMFHTAIAGLTCSAFLILLSSSSVSQELGRQGSDAASGN